MTIADTEDQLPKTLNILVLEDDALDAELEITMLQRAGFTCQWQRVVAETDFLEALDVSQFDLILADYNLPAFDGLGALELFLAREIDIPFILVSGMLGEDRAIESLKAGATDYVLKSSLTRLVPAVERALKEKAEQRQRKRAEMRVQRLLKQQTAANQLALSLGESRKLGEIYEIIYQHIVELMDAESFIISFYDRSLNVIQAGYVISDGKAIDTGEFPSIPMAAEGQGIQSQIIRTGEPLYVPDFPQALEATQTQYTFTESGVVIPGNLIDEDKPVTKSAILVPMKDRGSTIGVLQVQSYRLDAYSQEDVDQLAALANVASIAIQNARLLQEAESRMKNLQALHDIDMAISASIDLQITLGILVDQIIEQLNVDAVSVYLLTPKSQFLDHASGRGFRTSPMKAPQLRLSEGLSGKVALNRRPLMIENLSEFEISEYLRGEDFRFYYGIPLIAKGQVKGVLAIYHRSQMHPEQEWMNFLNTLAIQAAIAIDNSTLFSDLQRSNLELTLAYDITLEGWSKALELRDLETEGHTRRVADLSSLIGRELGLSKEELVHLYRGALLHDIGKMGIPDSILQKPDVLTDEEMSIMRDHVRYAYEWLSPIEFLQKALDVPYRHHEKWDGTGYPRQLAGEQIPLAARIFSVVDVWDALCSDRPYRKAWSMEKALEYIREQSGKHFDPQVVEVFLQLINNER